MFARRISCNADMERYKVMKLIDEIHEIMNYIDDGYHNKEVHTLVALTNELFEHAENVKEEGS